MGREAYEPGPEPSSSEDEGERNDPQEPGSAEEELDADAASDAWSDPAIPKVQARNTVIEYYHYTLGFTRVTAHSLYMDQGLHKSKHLIGIGDCDSVDRVCKYVHIEAKTTIALQAPQHLSMLVHYLRHQEKFLVFIFQMVSYVFPFFYFAFFCHTNKQISR